MAALVASGITISGPQLQKAQQLYQSGTPIDQVMSQITTTSGQTVTQAAQSQAADWISLANQLISAFSANSGSSSSSTASGSSSTVPNQITLNTTGGYTAGSSNSGSKNYVPLMVVVGIIAFLLFISTPPTKSR